MWRRSQNQKDERHENRLFLQWRQWRRDQVRQLLAGPYANASRALLTTLRNMPPAPVLLKTIETGPWCGADADTRHVILGLVDFAIIRHREQQGLAPFDDALPGQPENVFLRLRTLLACDDLRPDGAAIREAEPGGIPGN